MRKSRTERRGTAPKGERTPFGTVVRTAIHRGFREARSQTAHWETSANLTWVRWALEDGRFAYCGIRRRMDFLTGEVGVSSSPLDLEDLPLITVASEAISLDCRIQLGNLLHGYGKWWSTGGTEAGFNHRIEWLIQQLQMQVHVVVHAARRAA